MLFFKSLFTANGPLDTKIKFLVDERNDLKDEIRRLTLDLDAEKANNRRNDRAEDEETRKNNKFVQELSLNYNKSQTDLSSCQNNVTYSFKL